MRLGLPSALPICFAAALSGQGAKPALDVLPEKTLGFLLFRDPVLTQVKMQGLCQRLGSKVDDPLTEAQKAFNLPQLPAGRQGMAIVYLEDAAPGAGGSQRELLYLSPADGGAFLAKLHAVEAEKGCFSYKAGGKTYAAVQRDGWVLLADAGAKAQLKRMAAAPPLRGSLGALGAWMEGEEAYGALTPKGLWAAFHEMKKAASAATEGKSGAGQVDAFAERAESELSLLAFRGHLDENGNLAASLRARLNPAGAWMAIGRDLPLASDSGLAGLPKIPFAVAAGGAIPRAWMEGLVDLGIAPLRARLSAQGATEDGLAKVDAAIKQEGAHVQGLAMVMPSLGFTGARMLLRVDDSRAYEDGLKAEVQALAEACSEKNIPVPVHFESKEVSGRREFGPVPEADPAWASLDPELRARLTANQPRFTYVAQDGQTVLASMGKAADPSGGEGGLAEDDGIRRVAAMLPKEGTFFAFMSFSAIFRQQAESMNWIDGRLAPDLKLGLPAIPDVPDAPPIGLSIRFDLDQWDLSAAFPVETQLAMGRTSETMDKAQMARFRAFREQMKRDEAERKAKAPAKPDSDADGQDEYEVDDIVETPDPKK